MRNDLLRNGWGLVVIGLGFIAGGAWNAWSTQRFLATAAHAEGVVVSIKRHEHRGSGSGRDKTRPWTEFAPVVEFTTADREFMHLELKTDDSRAAYVVGQRVELRYREDAPEDAVIDDGSAWHMSMHLAAFGAAFVAVGAVLLAYLRRTGSAP